MSLTHATLIGLLLLACLATPIAESQEPRSANVYDLSCSYTASDDAPNRSANQIDYDWDRYEHCARLAPDGRMTVDPAHLERVHVKDGLARVLVDHEGWYYVHPDGRSLGVITHSNDPDPWSEGYVRGEREGKIVYFNRQFEEATGYRYDWAWPFDNGRALVCQGCVMEDSQYEHHFMVGGSWWLIDHAGNQIEREHLSEEEIARLERHAQHGRLR